jgi:hypothetical protein
MIIPIATPIDVPIAKPNFIGFFTAPVLFQLLIRVPFATNAVLSGKLQLAKISEARTKSQL